MSERCYTNKPALRCLSDLHHIKDWTDALMKTAKSEKQIYMKIRSLSITEVSS